MGRENRNAILEEARSAIAPKAGEKNAEVFHALTRACAKIESLKKPGEIRADMTKIWTCKIGECSEDDLLPGADSPMRQAVAKAYREITGREPDFMFTGWGGELDEFERAVVDGPTTQPTVVATDS